MSALLQQMSSQEKKVKKYISNTGLYFPAIARPVRVNGNQENTVRNYLQQMNSVNDLREAVRTAACL